MPTSTPKTMKINENSFVFQYFLQNRPFEVDIDLWFDFGANMHPFSIQKSIKIGSKLELGRHRIFDRFSHGFLIDFPSIGDANLELCWPLRRLQDASKTAPKTKCATFFAPAVILLDCWSFLFDCWLMLGRFLVNFPSIVGRFRVDVWKLFSAQARWRTRSFAARWIVMNVFSLDLAESSFN